MKLHERTEKAPDGRVRKGTEGYGSIFYREPPFRVLVGASQPFQRRGRSSRIEVESTFHQPADSA